jgi:hypothetical protein
MTSMARTCCLVFVFSMVAALAPTELRADSSAESTLRARKFAARRYGGMVVALPDSAFANGLRVCAKEAPSGIVGTWRVPAKVADAIDTELRAQLRKTGVDKALPFSFSLYVRQYAGFVRDGKRFVYVNALLVEKSSPMVEQVKKGFPASCSSVSGSWGIQYDPSTQKFASFTKN